LSNGINGWHKEWKTEHDTPFRTKLRQRAIHQGLLTSQRFDQRVRKLQILLQRKTMGANPAFCIPILMLASPPLIPGQSRMRKRACTDLCGGAISDGRPYRDSCARP
jgi:hypothetical protein